MNRRVIVTGLSAFALLAGAVACSAKGEGSSANQGGSSATTAQATTPATSGAVASPSATATTGSAATAVAAAKVSANTASAGRLQAAFEAAGIANAASWTREVEEYRPYPQNDPTFAKLRQELAKYNPGPGVVDAIVATLTP